MRTRYAFSRRILPALSAVLLVALTVSVCRTADAQAYDWYPSSPLAPGIGVETDNPTLLKGTAVAFDSLTPDDTSSPISSDPKYDVIVLHTTGELESFTTFDALLNANYLFFNGGGNVPWLSSYNFSKNTLVWGVRTYCDFGKYTIVNPRLTDEAKGLTVRLTDFKAQYGDSYVSTVRKGALIAVIFSIDDMPPDSLEGLRRILGVGLRFGITNGKVVGNLDTFLKQAITVAPINVRFITLGVPDMSAFSGVVATEPDIDKLDGLLVNYGAQMNEAASVPVAYYTAPYSNLGVTLPESTSPPGEQKLLDLANHYYSAAQKTAKLDSITKAWFTDYDYVDRDLLPTYQSYRDQYNNYINTLIALAPQIVSSPATTTIPSEPTIDVPWPNPSIAFTYHSVTVTDPATSTTYKYTAVDGVIKRAVVKEVLLEQSGATLFDLTEAQQDSPYLNAHIADNNFENGDVFYSLSPDKPGVFKSDSYVMRWILPGQQTALSDVTVVALDPNGKAITTCPLLPGTDTVYTSPPPNHLSE